MERGSKKMVAFMVYLSMKIRWLIDCRSTQEWSSESMVTMVDIVVDQYK